MVRKKFYGYLEGKVLAGVRRNDPDWVHIDFTDGTVYSVPTDPKELETIWLGDEDRQEIKEDEEQADRESLSWSAIKDGYRRAGLDVPFEEIADFVADRFLRGESQATEIALWWHLIKDCWPWEVGPTQEVQLTAMIDAVDQGDHGWLRELARQGR